MNLNIRETTLKTVKPGEVGFTLVDGLVVAQRAGFEINQQCPREYKLILQECINRGWLKPVAVVHDYELTWDSLRQ